MKHRIFFYLTLLSFIFSITAFSQEQRFLQVIVSESYTLAPVQITYEVSTQTESMVLSPSMDSSAKTELFPSVKISEVEKMLTDENFSIKESNPDYTISSYIPEKDNIVVKLNTVSELKRLYKFVKTINGVTGKVIAIDYESPEPYIIKMYETLYSKAVKEASALAGITGSEIGKIISAADVKDEMDNYINMIMEYSRSIPSEIIANNPDLTKQVSRKMQFKFELK